jgi:hypothetical protein
LAESKKSIVAPLAKLSWLAFFCRNSKNLQFRGSEQLGRKQRRVGERHDLIGVAMKDQSQLAGRMVDSVDILVEHVEGFIGSFLGVGCQGIGLWFEG